ncbi:portal protein [Asticcacaulis sp.]|uniref:portal protein n=1 Tax=Asticcacaulis sp. TaxID=1872648 RepID=UPI0031D4B2A8
MAQEPKREPISDKKRLQKRLSSLQTERSGWMSVWQELSDHIQPFSGRFSTDQRNRATRNFNNIIDDAATGSLEILAAGLMSGLTSPARPWFRLGVPESTGLRDDHAVKSWLADCQRVLLGVFAKSNTYHALHFVYKQLGLFGTACSVVMDDYDTVLHHYPVPVGEFLLASDFRGNVNTVYREFDKTVEELVGEFGYSNCSVNVRNLYDQNALDRWHTIFHSIEPRKSRDPMRADAKNMAFRSTYFEKGGNDELLLRDGGMTKFRALCPRWDKEGGDVYGTSPAMRALGAVKQLQHEQIRKANGIDQMTKPAVQVPMSMRNSEVDMLPGGVTFVDMAGPNSAIRNLMDVRINLEHLGLDIQEVRQRIRAAFYTDLFLLITNSTDTQKTATEIAERHEEKMLVLGPVLERLQSELLAPLIEIGFDRCAEIGLLPEPPEVLAGMPLEIEYISVLAQAQRMIATNGIDRFVGAIGAVAAFKPAVLDKFNEDKWADTYAELLGVDPDIVRSDEDVAAIRQARAQAEQQARMAEAVNMAADSAAKLGNVNLDQNTAASSVIEQLSGYGAPTAEASA